MEERMHSSEPPVISRRRALLVENEGLTVVLMERALRKAGYEVVGAVPDGEQAIELARLLLPDFILMNLGIKGENGLEAMKRILAERVLPVLIVTGYSDPEFKEAAFTAGACGYLAKPVTPFVLIPAIEECFAKFDSRMLGQ